MSVRLLLFASFAWKGLKRAEAILSNFPIFSPKLSEQKGILCEATFWVDQSSDLNHRYCGHFTHNDLTIMLFKD